MARSAAAEKVRADAIAAAPLIKFKIAPENPRAGRKEIEHLDELTANMAAHGQLQPVIVYRDKDTFWITAGRRRHAAAMKAELGVLAYIELSKAEAIAAGLAEQEAHVAMHPADQAVAWAAQLKVKGATAASIANAFGVSERLVLQRVALAALHPPILKALAENQITLEAAQLWANAPVERQATVFKKLGKGAMAWRIREELVKGKFDGTDRLAKFVGEEAYLGAGGKIERELFGYREYEDDEDLQEPQTWWADRDLAEKLADQKLAAHAETLKAAGWGDVRWGDHTQVEDLTVPTSRPRSKAEKAEAVVFINVDYHGKIGETVYVERKAARAAAKKKGAKDKPAAKGEQPPMTNGAHEQLTRAAGAILVEQFAREPYVALTCLLAHLARDRWDDESRYELMSDAILKLQRPFTERPRSHDQPTPQMQSDMELETRDEAWRKKVGKLENAEATIAGFNTDEKMSLLAHLLGHYVNIAEPSAAREYIGDVQRKRVRTLFQLSPINPTDYYVVSQDLLQKFSVAELHKVCKQLSIEPGKTKKATAEAVALAAVDKCWIPDLVHEILGTKGGKTKPTKKPRAKK